MCTKGHFRQLDNQRTNKQQPNYNHTQNQMFQHLVLLAQKVLGFYPPLMTHVAIKLLLHFIKSNMQIIRNVLFIILCL